MRFYGKHKLVKWAHLTCGWNKLLTVNRATALEDFRSRSGGQFSTRQTYSSWFQTEDRGPGSDKEGLLWTVNHAEQLWESLRMKPGAGSEQNSFSLNTSKKYPQLFHILWPAVTNRKPNQHQEPGRPSAVDWWCKRLCGSESTAPGKDIREEQWDRAGLEGRCLRETSSGSFSVTASATRRRGFNLSRAKQETTDSNTQLESRWLDRHIPTHIHTNTHTPTHHPRQVCLLCLCCTALHVFSQGQSERCPRSHQEKNHSKRFQMPCSHKQPNLEKSLSFYRTSLIGNF